MTSEFLVSVPKSLEYEVVKTSKSLRMSQSDTIIEALKTGLLLLRDDPKKAAWARADRRDYVISVPSRLEDDISRTAKLVGKVEFQTVGVTLKIGLAKLIKAPKKAKSIVEKRVKVAKASISKAIERKPIALVSAETLQAKPVAPAPIPTTPPILQSKIEKIICTDTLNSQSVAKDPKPEISLPKDYLHRYFCKICDDPVDVPHSDYLALKESTGNGVRLQCKKHGGYAYLLRAREKISA